MGRTTLFKRFAGDCARAAGVLAVACMCLGGGCPPNQNCGEIDVWTIDDGTIPQQTKNAILYSPGPIISKYHPNNPENTNPSFPSGKIVVIPFETPDFPHNPAITSGYIFLTFFATGELSGVSVAQYFLENSWGDFHVTNGGIADCVTLSSNLTSYVGFEGDDDLPRDVLRLADINWPALDTNNDDVITPAEAQIVFLVSNGYSAAKRGFADWTTGSAVPLASIQADTPSGIFKFKPSVVYIGTKKADDPNFDDNAIRIHSTICHELCHAFFNLPDGYAGGCGSGTTGRYAIMSDSLRWHHMNIHDTMKIVWIQPKIVAGHLIQYLSFRASESVPAALVLLTPSAPPLATDEYWMVENRYRPSSDCNGCLLYHPADGVFDAGLPESGLALWYVREGTWSSGHDDVRLVDANAPHEDPDGTTDINGSDPGYHSQGAGALFKKDDADPQKLLINGQGKWSFLFFRDVSEPGSTVCAEF